MSAQARASGRLPASPDGRWGAAQGGGWYAGWEASVLHSCVCDAGYFGADCSLRACARGDDPLTVAQQGRSVTLTAWHPARALGSNDSLGLALGGETAFFSARADARAIRAAVEALRAVRRAAVSTAGAADAPGARRTIVITVTEFAAVDDGAFPHDGDPPLAFFFCDTTRSADGATAAAAPGAAAAAYSVVVVAPGNAFLWRRDGDDGYSGPVTMLVGGNAELAAVPAGSVRLRFEPAYGRPAGEAPERRPCHKQPPAPHPRRAS
jgi:hypothetical protein